MGMPAVTSSTTRASPSSRHREADSTRATAAISPVSPKATSLVNRWATRSPAAVHRPIRVVSALVGAQAGPRSTRR